MEDIEVVRPKIEDLEKHCNGFCWGKCDHCPTKRKLQKLMTQLKILFELTDMEEDDYNDDNSGNDDRPVASD